MTDKIVNISSKQAGESVSDAGVGVSSSVENLISKLSVEGKISEKKALSKNIFLKLISIVFIYSLVVQGFLRVPETFLTDIKNPLLQIELLLLGIIAITSLRCSVNLITPDENQKKNFIIVPYILFGILLLMIGYEGIAHEEMRQIHSLEYRHGVMCTVCIGIVSIFPALMIFRILKKGAVVKPFIAGSMAVIMSSSVGAITLRISESADSFAHVGLTHYLPVVIFSILGAWLGKILLKW